jgi:hypothetical protein
MARVAVAAVTERMEGAVAAATVMVMVTVVTQLRGARGRALARLVAAGPVRCFPHGSAVAPGLQAPSLGTRRRCPRALPGYPHRGHHRPHRPRRPHRPWQQSLGLGSPPVFRSRCPPCWCTRQAQWWLRCPYRHDRGRGCRVPPGGPLGTRTAPRHMAAPGHPRRRAKGVVRPGRGAARVEGARGRAPGATCPSPAAPGGPTLGPLRWCPWRPARARRYHVRVRAPRAVPGVSTAEVPPMSASLGRAPGWPVLWGGIAGRACPGPGQGCQLFRPQPAPLGRCPAHRRGRRGHAHLPSGVLAARGAWSGSAWRPGALVGAQSVGLGPQGPDRAPAVGLGGLWGSPGVGLGCCGRTPGRGTRPWRCPAPLRPWHTIPLGTHTHTREEPWGGGGSS